MVVYEEIIDESEEEYNNGEKTQPKPKYHNKFKGYMINELFALVVFRNYPNYVID